MPLCGVYRRVACKFSKVGREDGGSATEKETKNESATEESCRMWAERRATKKLEDCHMLEQYWNEDPGFGVCKKCHRTKEGSLHIAEIICESCRNKRSAMSKWFGEWPIEMFEDMPEEQQKAFWLGE